MLTVVLLCYAIGIVAGWMIAGSIFLRSVGAPPSPHKGWFYTLVRLVFWYRLLSIQVRDIRAIKMLESTLKK